jgi:hypothetical protein
LFWSSHQEGSHHSHHDCYHSHKDLITFSTDLIALKPNNLKAIHLITNPTTPAINPITPVLTTLIQVSLLFNPDYRRQRVSLVHNDDINSEKNEDSGESEENEESGGAM